MADLKQHILDAGEEPDILRSHLRGGHRIKPSGDHREMDKQHIEAHQRGKVAGFHVRLDARTFDEMTEAEAVKPFRLTMPDDDDEPGYERSR